MRGLALCVLAAACSDPPVPVAPAASVTLPEVARHEPARGNVQVYARAPADLDGDGTLERVAGGYATTATRRRATVLIYRQAGATWTLLTEGGWLGGGGGDGSAVRAVEIADLDGDGRPEVIALGRVGMRAREASARLVVLALADGHLHELAKAEWNAGRATEGSRVAVADLDGDGRPEITTAGLVFDGTTERAFERTWSYDGALAVRADR